MTTDKTEVSEETKDSKKPRATTDLGKIAAYGLTLAGLVILAATSLRLFATQWWVADLFCQFAVQYVLLLIPIVLGLFFIGRRKSAALFLIAWLVNVIVISPYIPIAADRPVLDDTLRLLTQNVLTSNRDYQSVIDLIDNEQPDFVVLIEIDRGWINGMSELHFVYPFRKTVTHSGNFGIGIYSKIPWTDCQARDTGPDRLPTIYAEFTVNDKPFQIVGTHPFPPVGGGPANSRNQQLIEVAESMNLSMPRILTGDFNLTPWSPWFSRVLEIAQLQDPATIFDITPTWYLFPTILGGVKIDHALVADLKVTDHRIGTDVNSDHRAVILDFSVSND